MAGCGLAHCGYHRAGAQWRRQTQKARKSKPGFRAFCCFVTLVSYIVFICQRQGVLIDRRAQIEASRLTQGIQMRSYHINRAVRPGFQQDTYYTNNS